MAQWDDYDPYQYAGMGGGQRMTFDGKRMRTKAVNRKTVDFNSPVITHFQVCSKLVQCLLHRIVYIVVTTKITNTLTLMVVFNKSGWLLWPTKQTQ